MEKIAVIGLGIMGMPMADNLRKAGYRVTGYNRTRSKVDAFEQLGGHGAASIAEAVADADAIITNVSDSPDVEQVVTGPDGVFENAKRGALWIDASTIRPDVATRLAATARTYGLRPLDAPVSGGQKGAIEGILSVMVGGDKADFDAAMEIFEVVGKAIAHVGPSGAGQTCKAANQLIVAVTTEAVAEAIALLEAYGVDVTEALGVLAGGMAGSRTLDHKGPQMVARDFAPGFKLALQYKDIKIVTDTARSADVSAPLAAHVSGLLGNLVARGDGELDVSALYKQVAANSGRDEGSQGA